MTLSERLKLILESPEDLSTLPELIKEVETLEEEFASANDKIGELHEINRKYLSMIPIEDETEVKEEEQEIEVTVEDAVQSILEGLEK